MSFRRNKRLSDTQRNTLVPFDNDQFDCLQAKAQLFHFSRQGQGKHSHLKTGRSNDRYGPQIISSPYQIDLEGKGGSRSRAKSREKATLDGTIFTSRLPKFKKEQLEISLNTNFAELGTYKKVAKNMKHTIELYQQLNNFSLNNFTLQFVIGKGGFGKVWKVIEKSTKKIYAMKQMKKSKIILKQSIQAVINEKNLLAQLKHPFLVNIYCSFQDWQYLYLVTDYCNRGDLRYHLSIYKTFSQQESCFFIACIIICLEYLHSKGVIHRDLKPQNMVLDKNGYVKLTDLGVSKIVTLRNFQDTSGTPGYMAPQVLFRTNHSFGVDFYALGVVAFQFMTGKRPYSGANRQELKQKMLAHQVQISSDQTGWSIHGIDFVNRLIQRKPQARLGFNGMSEVKKHPFFNGINWKLFQKKKLHSPFIPYTIQQDYASYKMGISDDTVIQDIQEQEIISRFQGRIEAFRGYQYDTRQQRLGRTLKSSSQKRHASRN